MFPTLAAHKKTYSGFSCPKNVETDFWFNRSSSFLFLTTMLVNQSACNLLRSDHHTSPVCHAIYIFAFLSICNHYNE